MPVLPRDVRLRIADLARILDGRNRDKLYDVIQLPVQLIWELDRRCTGTKAQKALIRAADAARAFHEAVADLSPDDREWVEELRAKVPQYEKCLPVLARSVEAAAGLFSVAVNKAPPQAKSGRGRRPGDVEHFSFRQFVIYLRVVTEAWCGGTLTLDKNYQKGTLIEAIRILEPYLPVGVVPRSLPLQAIQRDKDNPGSFTTVADIRFFRAK
jgi:hypothetical protein